ncbi:MAG: hypothetical protein KC609_21105, partial [Myxococcales bacterium]|nr:hypothetical protein [Myxococcales bacterium]
MVLRDPMRSAAQRCGLDELAERLGFDAATYDADDELQSELGAALEEEELDDREESVLELLIEHPHNAELISGLVEGKLFADRPIDGALFGWDGLQLCLYHPAQHDAVDAMREAARGFPHLLPPPAVHRTILKGEALAQATWQSLQLRRHTGEATTEAGQAKRRAVRDGCVLLEDRDALIAAALDEADLEAALIL